MRSERFKSLLALYYNGTISFAERKELDELLRHHPGDAGLADLMPDEVLDAYTQGEVPAELMALTYQNIKLNIASPAPKVVQIKKYIPLIAAAVVLFILSVCLYFNSLKEKTINKTVAAQTIVPGSNKATITLSNGQRLVLSDSIGGQIATQSGVVINKTANGEIEYQVSPSAYQQSVEPLYNTITIPRGGQYQLVLPDGTKVWMNSSSSLTYPVIFKGSKRQVSLTGEAYFEVAKNKQMPFIVESKKQTLEVLGTHFNVNAYDDEPAVKTTLLEGSIKIIAVANKMSRVLVPGEQAHVDQNIEIRAVDAEGVVSWKNGLFVFNKQTVEAAMRQLARWYDVEVEYKGNVSAKGFWGSIPRNKDLNYVLKMLEATGVAHFKLTERRVTVMP